MQAKRLDRQDGKEIFIFNHISCHSNILAFAQSSVHIFDDHFSSHLEKPISNVLNWPVGTLETELSKMDHIWGLFLK
jgi:hypothetical protein